MPELKFRAKLQTFPSYRLSSAIRRDEGGMASNRISAMVR